MINRTVGRAAARKVLQDHQSNAIQDQITWEAVNAALEAVDAELYDRPSEGYLVEYRREILGTTLTKIDAQKMISMHRKIHEGGVASMMFYKIRPIPNQAVRR